MEIENNITTILGVAVNKYFNIDKKGTYTIPRNFIIKTSNACLIVGGKDFYKIAFGSNDYEEDTTLNKTFQVNVIKSKEFHEINEESIGKRDKGKLLALHKICTGSKVLNENEVVYCYFTNGVLCLQQKEKLESAFWGGITIELLEMGV